MSATVDRYGEPLTDAVESVEPPHDPACVAGWLPEADDGLAVPCLVCRPHLDAVRRRTRWLLGRGA